MPTSLRGGYGDGLAGQLVASEVTICLPGWNPFPWIKGLCVLSHSPWLLRRELLEAAVVFPQEQGPPWQTAQDPPPGPPRLSHCPSASMCVLWAVGWIKTWNSFSHAFIRAFKQLFMEHLLIRQACSRHWAYRSANISCHHRLYSTGGRWTVKMKKSIFNSLPGSRARPNRAEVGGKNDEWGEVLFEGCLSRNLQGQCHSRDRLALYLNLFSTSGLLPRLPETAPLCPLPS